MPKPHASLHWYKRKKRSVSAKNAKNKNVSRRCSKRKKRRGDGERQK
jgi:hypothetical protein